MGSTKKRVERSTIPATTSSPATAKNARRWLDLGALFIYVALASLLQLGARDFLSEFK